MKQQVTLFTPRLVLKSITPEIVIALFTTKTKEAICAYLNVDENGYKHYKDMFENGMTTHRISMFCFLIIDKVTNIAIGECGYHTWNDTHRRADIFYHIKEEKHKQQGIMTETLQAVIEYGFTHLNLHRIAAYVDANNIASVKLLEKYKFIKEGTAREDYNVNGTNENSESYSLLKSEWHNNKN